MQGLLDLLEKNLDAPPGLVQFADRRRGPLEVVGDEGHFFPFALDHHPGLHQPQGLPPVVFIRLRAGQPDLHVADDVAPRLRDVVDDLILHVVLAPGDPEHPPPGQVAQVDKIHVGLVEHGDFPGREAGADGGRLMRVVVPCRLDDDKARQEGAQVKAQVHFRGGLLPAVLRPVHAIGDKLDGCGIDGVYGSLETPGHGGVAFPAGTASESKLRMRLLKQGLDLPEELLRHAGATDLVGMGKAVAARRGASAQGGQGSAVIPEGVADVVQADRMGQLGIHERDHVAGGAERAGLFVDPVLPCQLWNQISWNELEKLLDDGKLTS